MTLYEMLSFHSPFSSEKCVPKRNHHVRNKKRPELHDKEKLSPILFRDLMAMCWSHEPRQRPVMSKVKTLADKVEFQLLRAASNLGNITKRKLYMSCACVFRTFPSAITSHEAIGGNVIRQISEYKETIHSEQSDPVIEAAENCEHKGTSNKAEVQFSSDESLNKPSTQIWVFERESEHKPESKAAIYTYQDGFRGCYRRSAVSNKINIHTCKLVCFYLKLVLL